MHCFVLGEVDLCNVVPHRKTFSECVAPACWSLMTHAQFDLCMFFRINQMSMTEGYAIPRRFTLIQF